MRVVTGLDRVLQDAPSSMMHGAAMAVLHITPLSLITPVQQLICQQAKAVRRVFIRLAWPMLGGKQDASACHTLVDAY